MHNDVLNAENAMLRMQRWECSAEQLSSSFRFSSIFHELRYSTDSDIHHENKLLDVQILDNVTELGSTLLQMSKVDVQFHGYQNLQD